MSIIKLNNVPFDKIYRKELDKALEVFNKDSYKLTNGTKHILLEITEEESKLSKWFETYYDHMKWSEIRNKYESEVKGREDLIKSLRTYLEKALKNQSKFYNISGIKDLNAEIKFILTIDNTILLEPLLLGLNADKEDIELYFQVSKNRRRALDEVFAILGMDDINDIISDILKKDIVRYGKPEEASNVEVKPSKEGSIIRSIFEISFIIK